MLQAIRLLNHETEGFVPLKVVKMQYANLFLSFPAPMWQGKPGSTGISFLRIVFQIHPFSASELGDSFSCNFVKAEIILLRYTLQA